MFETSAGQRIFDQLTVDVQDRIISFLDPNDVAATARLICKAAAVRYSAPQHTRIRLSRPVPTHAFAHRWGRTEAMRSVSYRQREDLLDVTVASGSIANLQVLLPVVGCAIGPGTLAAAAAAGHLGMCQWLRAQDCPWSDKAMEAAGRSGSRALCDWLLAAGCPGGAGSALAGAARGGHVDLVDQLLASYGPPEESAEVLAAVAYGCDLPSLVRLYAVLLANAAQMQLPGARKRPQLLEAAAVSPTPDWREKLEWLGAQGYLRHECVALAVLCRPDALERFTWLYERSWPFPNVMTAANAGATGDMALLEFVLQTQGEKWRRWLESGALDSAVFAAAHKGSIPGLEYLRGRGWRLEMACEMAALGGHLQAVAWLAETLGAEVLTEGVFEAAARSGSLPLLTWLRERGCVCRDARVMDGALEVGRCSEEMLEWLLDQGCILQLTAKHLVAAARRGDLATLAWLRRWGCPWVQNGSTFTEAVRLVCPLPALRWLVEAGCPVDWAAALKQARAGVCEPGVLAWLEEQRM